MERDWRWSTVSCLGDVVVANGNCKTAYDVVFSLYVASQHRQ